MAKRGWSAIARQRAAAQCRGVVGTMRARACPASASVAPSAEQRSKQAHHCPCPRCSHLTSSQTHHPPDPHLEVDSEREEGEEPEHEEGQLPQQQAAAEAVPLEVCRSRREGWQQTAGGGSIKNVAGSRGRVCRAVTAAEAAARQTGQETTAGGGASPITACTAGSAKAAYDSPPPCQRLSSGCSSVGRAAQASHDAPALWRMRSSWLFSSVCVCVGNRSAAQQGCARPALPLACSRPSLSAAAAFFTFTT